MQNLNGAFANSSLQETSGHCTQESILQILAPLLTYILCLCLLSHTSKLSGGENCVTHFIPSAHAATLGNFVVLKS